MSDSGKSINHKVKTSPEGFPEKHSSHSILMWQGDQVIRILLPCFFMIHLAATTTWAKTKHRGFPLVVPHGLKITSLTSTFLARLVSWNHFHLFVQLNLALGPCTLAQKYTVALSRRLKTHTHNFLKHWPIIFEGIISVPD